jgi:hypothetical protein
MYFQLDGDSTRPVPLDPVEAEEPRRALELRLRYDFKLVDTRMVEGSLRYYYRFEQKTGNGMVCVWHDKKAAVKPMPVARTGASKSTGTAPLAALSKGWKPPSKKG